MTDPRAALADELLPCPFCGGPAKLTRLEGIQMTQIECGNDEGCHACADVQHTDEAVAVKTWNARSPSPYSGAAGEAKERAYEACRDNLREAWSALAIIRETVETLAPSGSVKAAEHLDGPTFMHEADALVAGILAITHPPTLPRDAERETIERHDATYLRGWNEGIERVIELLTMDGWVSVPETIRRLIDALPSIPPREGVDK